MSTEGIYAASRLEEDPDHWHKDYETPAEERTRIVEANKRELRAQGVPEEVINRMYPRVARNAVQNSPEIRRKAVCTFRRNRGKQVGCSCGQHPELELELGVARASGATQGQAPRPVSDTNTRDDAT